MRMVLLRGASGAKVPLPVPFHSDGLLPSGCLSEVPRRERGACVSILARESIARGIEIVPGSSARVSSRNAASSLPPSPSSLLHRPTLPHHPSLLPPSHHTPHIARSPNILRPTSASFIHCRFPPFAPICAISPACGYRSKCVRLAPVVSRILGDDAVPAALTPVLREFKDRAPDSFMPGQAKLLDFEIELKPTWSSIFRSGTLCILNAKTSCPYL